MKRLSFLAVFLFLFPHFTYAQMIAIPISPNEFVAIKLIKFWNYVYLYHYASDGGVFRMKADLTDNWTQMVVMSGEGDMTITLLDYIVASGRDGTVLSID